MIHSHPQFQTEIRNRLYPNWGLDDVGLWRGGAELYDTQQLISKAVPTISSFCGRGHMEQVERERLW